MYGGVLLNERRERSIKNGLTRLVLPAYDFQQALSAATFLFEEVDWEERYSLADMRRFRCYELALIVSYCRPFSQAEGEVGSLSWKKIAIERSGEETALHEKFVTLRNRVYAHTDADYASFRTLLLQSEIGDGGPDFNFIMPRFDEGLRLTQQEVFAAYKLLHRIVAAVSEALQAGDPSMFDGIEVRRIDLHPNGSARRASDADS